MKKVLYYYPEQSKELSVYINGHVKVLAKHFDKTFAITIQEKKPHKTWQQCKGWHRILNVIVDLFNEHNVSNQFWQLKHVKDLVKKGIQYGEYKKIEHGNYSSNQFILKSFADASKEEAIDVISKTQEFAVDVLNMELEAVQLTSHEQQSFNEYYEKYE